MKNLLLSLALCAFTSSHAGRIGWDVITVNHFWTIFDTIKPGNVVPAELIGAQDGEYQFNNNSFTGIEGYDYFFFIPHPGPGHPIRVTTRDTLYGKRPIAQDWGNDSKALTECRAGSVYNNLSIGNPIAIEGIRYVVTEHYPRIDALRIFTLMGNDKKQKKLTLKNREDVGVIFISCEDMLGENIVANQEQLEGNIVAYQEDDEEFNSCCTIAAQCAFVLLKRMVTTKSHDKIS